MKQEELTKIYGRDAISDLIAMESDAETESDNDEEATLSEQNQTADSHRTMKTSMLVRRQHDMNEYLSGRKIGVARKTGGAMGEFNGLSRKMQRLSSEEQQQNTNPRSYHSDPSGKELSSSCLPLTKNSTTACIRGSLSGW
ncbi:hypothetical protein Peur_015405 [Populus x canadensis]